MAENRLVFLLNITILLLIVFSSCNAYQLYRDSSSIYIYDIMIDIILFFEYFTGLIRPIKYHVLNDPDRQVDRVRCKNRLFTYIKFCLLNR